MNRDRLHSFSWKHLLPHNTFPSSQFHNIFLLHITFQYYFLLFLLHNTFSILFTVFFFFTTLFDTIFLRTQINSEHMEQKHEHPLVSLERRSPCRWVTRRLDLFGSFMILLINSILVSNSLTLFFKSMLACSRERLFKSVVVSSRRLLIPVLVCEVALRQTFLASTLGVDSSGFISFHSALA